MKRRNRKPTKERKKQKRKARKTGKSLEEVKEILEETSPVVLDQPKPQPSVWKKMINLFKGEK